MKTSIAILILTIFTSISRAQDVVQWKFSSKKITDKTYEVHFTPTVQLPWHIYSANIPESNMARPTTFYFTKNPLIELVGKIKETGLQKDFVQALKLKTKVKTNLTGEITFMACTDTRCLPPETVKFSIKLE